MDLDAFDFDLPQQHIALRPVVPRDASRLLLVRGDGTLEDHLFSDLPVLLRRGDLLVFNETRVLPAALKGIRRARDADGRDVELDLNLVERTGEATWLALARPGRRLRPGDQVEFAGGFSARIEGRTDAGEVVLTFSLTGGELSVALETYGAMPLPPYIARRRPADVQDRTDYQTVFAAGEAASVAAPTAGLHMSPDLLARLEGGGIGRVHVSLTVGLGTFAPLTESQIESGRLHAEWRQITPDTASSLNAARAEHRRIIPVGTTALRTLESSVSADGCIDATSGATDIFLRPGDELRATDALITNFHLPRSSLFMLVCALMGTDVMQRAYAHAIAENYRFYSYGDACLLMP